MLNQVTEEVTGKLPLRLRLTGVQWLICITASLGFAFDIYEVLMMPLIIKPLLMDLGNLKPGSSPFNWWVGALFYLPAVAGGIFGLLGGYLADLLGRQRLLIGSILLYSFSACAASFATSLPVLLILRCTTFIGVSTEFVAAVAWVAELFPDPRQRESALGYTQAFGGIGGLLVTGTYYLAVTYADQLPTVNGGHQAWRYTLISGMIPALPLLVIRPFLPESRIWQNNRLKGEWARPHLRVLFSRELCSVTILTTLMFACSVAAAYGAIQHIPRIVAGLPEMAKVPTIAREQRISEVQLLQELGHLAGRVLLALLAVRVIRQRKLLRLFQVPALILFPLLFFVATRNLKLLGFAVFFATLFMTGQFSFWGNYLPRVYPTRLRATGEAFATNIGGRMIGTFAVVLTTQGANIMPGPNPSSKLAYAAGATALLVYTVGWMASFWLPEPRQAQLPD